MNEQNSVASKSTSHRRYLEIDFYRGVAILMMILFHLLFDLTLLQMAQIPIFTNPFWLVYRETGVFIFMSVSGFCLYMEHCNKIHWKNVWKRFFKLLAAGALITVATYYYNPSKTIWLGILQFFALAGLLGLLFLKAGTFNLVLGLLIVAFGFIGNMNEARNFIHPALTWIGFGTMRLETFEIFPLVPFFGYYLIGIYWGHYFLDHRKDDYFILRLNGQSPAIRFTSFMGKHSLLVYVIHQPVLLGSLYLLKQM